MPNIEAEDPQEQIVQLTARTIGCMRRMRGSIDALDYLGFFTPQAQPAFADARELGGIASLNIIDSEVTHDESRQEWEEILNIYESKYQKYSESSHLKTDKESVAWYIAGIRVDDLKDSWLESCNWLLLYNSLSAEVNVDDLLTPKTGVFSPLSVDFLLISVYQQYLRRLSPTGVFQLEPVYVGKKVEPVDVESSNERLSDVIFPLDREGKKPFGNCDKVLPLLDRAGVTTQPSIIRALRYTYKDKHFL